MLYVKHELIIKWETEVLPFLNLPEGIMVSGRCENHNNKVQGKYWVIHSFYTLQCICNKNKYLLENFWYLHPTSYLPRCFNTSCKSGSTISGPLDPWPLCYMISQRLTPGLKISPFLSSLSQPRRERYCGHKMLSMCIPWWL